MSGINFKTTEDLDWNEQSVAYTLYFLISVIVTLSYVALGYDIPRAFYIAIWGLPIGVVAFSYVKRELVSPRHLCREFIIGMLGFIICGFIMAVLNVFSIYTVYDLYYYFVAMTIYEIGLVFFYAFYTATGSMEQRSYTALAVPIAVVVMLLATYIALVMTRIYI